MKNHQKRIFRPNYCSKLSCRSLFLECLSILRCNVRRVNFRLKSHSKTPDRSCLVSLIGKNRVQRNYVGRDLAPILRLGGSGLGSDKQALIHAVTVRGSRLQKAADFVDGQPHDNSGIAVQGHAPDLSHAPPQFAKLG